MVCHCAPIARPLDNCDVEQTQWLWPLHGKPADIPDPPKVPIGDNQQDPEMQYTEVLRIINQSWEKLEILIQTRNNVSISLHGKVYNVCEVVTSSVGEQKGVLEFGHSE